MENELKGPESGMKSHSERFLSGVLDSLDRLEFYERVSRCGVNELQEFIGQINPNILIQEDSLNKVRLQNVKHFLSEIETLMPKISGMIEDKKIYSKIKSDFDFTMLLYTGRLTHPKKPGLKIEIYRIDKPHPDSQRNFLKLLPAFEILLEKLLVLRQDIIQSLWSYITPKLDNKNQSKHKEAF